MRSVSPNLFCLKKFYRTAIEVNKRLKTDIRDVIKEIEREVDKLDIDSIIDSYETTVSEWTLL